MKYIVRSKQLVVSDRIQSFPDNIKQVLELNEHLIVVLFNHGRVPRDTNNVWCVNSVGEIAWQIKAKYECYYLEVRIVDGELIVWDSRGARCVVDSSLGEIISIVNNG